MSGWPLYQIALGVAVEGYQRWNREGNASRKLATEETSKSVIKPPFSARLTVLSNADADTGAG